MSFFKKALSSIGIGAAKIDTVLDDATIAPGETLSGVINIKGGKADQSINKIDLDVRCNYFAEETYEKENDDGETEEHTRIIERTATLVAHDINESFVIHVDEDKTIPFSITFPLASPLTLGQSKTWVETNLDIDFALDKTDKDYVNVVPNALQQAVLAALTNLGFGLIEAENEAINNFELPFIQELEFKAHSGPFSGKLDELELIFTNNDNGLELFLEIDRKARGISGFFANLFNRDETKLKLALSEADIDEVEAILADIISANC